MSNSRLFKAGADLEQYCIREAITADRFETSSDQLGYFIPAKEQDRMEQLVELFSDAAKQSALLFREYALPTGMLLVLAQPGTPEDRIADLAEEAAACYNSFRSELTLALHPLSEINLKNPDSSLRRANSSNQFPASMQDYTRPGREENKPKKKGMDAKIEEALEGIATPNDIQPQQGLNSLFSALKRSGLAQELKKSGVSWHVAEPGKHAVTFVKGKVPVLQLTSIELGDAKKLGEVLAQLTSIAQGKAPQAAQLELDRVKEMAARANERKKALDNVAQQYAIPDPEEQQKVNLTRPQV